MVSKLPISFCMIVKDAQDVLAQCLSSVAEWTRELIVVDTGSVDRTVEIAKSFKAKVLQTKWEDDFSRARNRGLKAATQDWILVLDADEALDATAPAALSKLLSARNTCYSLTQRHYTNNDTISGFEPCKGEFPEWERNYLGFFESSCVRLFPNRMKLEFRGVVHELVEYCIRERPELLTVNSGVLIHHYGHVISEASAEKKRELYTRLGQKKLSELPEDWKGLFEMAVQFQNNRDFESSISAFVRALRLRPEDFASWVNIGQSLGETGRYAEAVQALLRAIHLVPRDEQAWCNLGVVHMRLRDNERAAYCLERALSLNQNFVNGWNNYGHVLLKLGKLDQAKRAFDRALEITPGNAKALEGLSLHASRTAKANVLGNEKDNNL